MSVTTGRILRLWLPLAGSWLLMGAEMPMVAAAINRLPDEETQLAALPIVYALALVVEAPVIMLLAAGTALAKDERSYRLLRRFTHVSGLVLTILHVLMAFTPLFDVIAKWVMEAPADTIEPARLGLQIMTPWTWAIAARRFQQGVLIRFGHGRAVVIGTAIRLMVNATVLLGCVYLGATLGIVAGTAAIAAGVTAEALFTTWVARPVVRDRIIGTVSTEEPLTLRRFLSFYIPLAITPLMTLVLQPIGALAMARMAAPKISLAAWSVVYALIFLTRSAGFAFNEVVVSLCREEGARGPLHRVAWGMAATTVGILALIAFTPVARLYFTHATDLSPDVFPVAVTAVGVGLLMPGYAVLQNLYQGYLVAHRRTWYATEAVALYLLIACSLLAAAVHWSPWPGVHSAILCLSVAGVCQTLWLRWRSASLRA